MSKSITNGSTGTHGPRVVLFESQIDKRTEMSMFMQQIRKQWSDEDYKRARDLQKFVLDKEDAWVLDKLFADFVGDVLTSISEETKVRLLKVFSVCALKDSFVHFLNQDREKRHIMNYANNFGKLSLDEQKALSLFYVHLFSNVGCQKWAMYFSEWKTGSSSGDGDDDDDDEELETTSNARITCKIARLSLLNLNPTLQKHGAALVYNIATRNAMVMQRPASMSEAENHDTEMTHSSLANNGIKGMATLRAFDAIALELSMVIIELINKGTFKLQEDVLCHCLTSLANLIPVIKSDLIHYHSNFAQDLKVLKEKKLSARNEELANGIIAQL